MGILDSGKPGFPADCILSVEGKNVLPQSRDNALLLIPSVQGREQALYCLTLDCLYLLV